MCGGREKIKHREEGVDREEVIPHQVPNVDRSHRVERHERPRRVGYGVVPLLERAFYDFWPPAQALVTLQVPTGVNPTYRYAVTLVE